MRQFIRIYTSWLSETSQLTDAEKGQLMDALIYFLIMDKEKPPGGNARFVYPLMIERIRRENSTHERKRFEREAKRNNDGTGIPGR